MFEIRRERITLEGIGVAVFLLAVVAVATWQRYAPLVYQVAPGFRATKTGPAGFPVVVRILKSGLSVTNSSGARWTCNVRIAAGRPVVVVLQPKESKDVAYEAFVGEVAAVSNDQGYRGAREWIGLTCTEDSGTTHSIAF